MQDLEFESYINDGSHSHLVLFESAYMLREQLVHYVLYGDVFGRMDVSLHGVQLPKCLFYGGAV